MVPVIFGEAVILLPIVFQNVFLDAKRLRLHVHPGHVCSKMTAKLKWPIKQGKNKTRLFQSIKKEKAQDVVSNLL